MSYISNIRGILKVFSPVPAPSVLKSLISEHFLAKINLQLDSYNWLLPIPKLARACYVSENKFSSVISKFKLDCAGLGDKQPRLGYVRQSICPVCPSQATNTGIHLILQCTSVSTLRNETGIQSFLSQCLLKGLTLQECYSHFINGLDSNGNSIAVKDYLGRGKCLRDMRDAWLDKW